MLESIGWPQLLFIFLVALAWAVSRRRRGPSSR
jgi:hypothetical protein